MEAKRTQLIEISLLRTKQTWSMTSSRAVHLERWLGRLRCHITTTKRRLWTLQIAAEQSLTVRTALSWRSTDKGWRSPTSQEHTPCSLAASAHLRIFIRAAKPKEKEWQHLRVIYILLVCFRHPGGLKRCPWSHGCWWQEAAEGRGHEDKEDLFTNSEQTPFWI